MVFRDGAESVARISEVDVESEKKASEVIPGLEIRKAEYGTFPPRGTIDVTDEVSRMVHDGSL